MFYEFTGNPDAQALFVQLAGDAMMYFTGLAEGGGAALITVVGLTAWLQRQELPVIGSNLNQK